jgi:thioredoxin reductase (NADPH)
MAAEMEHLDEKLVILGSGPAGLAAALYAARGELNPLVITGIDIGGQAALTNIIENYPGFPDGVGGMQLGEYFQRQAEKFGTRYEFDAATKVDLTATPFTLWTGSKEIKTQALIIASGAQPNLLGIPGEQAFAGKGVSYCATCDGWFFKNKKVAVVGGGDSALEEGIYLSRLVSEATIIHRRDTFRAGTLLQHRAMKLPNMKFMMNSIPLRILGTEKVTGIEVEDVISNGVKTLELDGVFVFIGHSPNTTLFVNQVKLDPKGFILIDSKMQTNIPGVFAAGEVADPHYRQVVTSAGMGAAAAMEAIRFLE